jgi:hypothetical protein
MSIFESTHSRVRGAASIAAMIAAFLLQGSGKPDNPLIDQARAALARGNA